jgi:hypothetical protein
MPFFSAKISPTSSEVAGILLLTILFWELTPGCLFFMSKYQTLGTWQTLAGLKSFCSAWISPLDVGLVVLLT